MGREGQIFHSRCCYEINYSTSLTIATSGTQMKKTPLTSCLTTASTTSMEAPPTTSWRKQPLLEPTRAIFSSANSKALPISHTPRPWFIALCWPIHQLQTITHRITGIRAVAVICNSARGKQVPHQQQLPSTSSVSITLSTFSNPQHNSYHRSRHWPLPSQHQPSSPPSARVKPHLKRRQPGPF